ncbi:uncharacterized protein LOC131804795 [Musca domestica]|uniref:Uncharacterized protein LOC131804795 n=1 Tax=Musca domestica TaxID=7370 RepID=A0ABM3VE75_MUSDO|nr:uncharacterized protein LOC131804795 [Musca domestica]
MSKKDKQKLQDELREQIGSDEYPLVKNTKIYDLTEEQLVTMLTERKIAVEYPIDRVLCEALLKASVNGDTVVLVELVKIDSLTYSQLEEAIKKVTKPRKTIREIQQELAKNCGYGDDVIWDQLSKKDSKIMQSKIKQLIPDQETGQKGIEKMRENIFESVWAQRKYTNGNSCTYIFYVMVTEETDFNIAPDSTKYSCHPIFRCKKCDANNDSSKCCMIYVDETGRVYPNWKSFLEENVLPAGTMILPRRGVYNFDKNDDVILDVYCTPNGTPGAKLMNAAQTSSAVLGVGAACVPIAAALTLPVAAPVMAAAGLVGLGVGAFSTITSALNLHDRKKHEQSINITDSQARASYLGIAGGVLGMAAAGATRFLNSMAVAGKATAGIEVVVNGINISTILVSGTGLANGVLDIIFKYRDDDTLSALDVLQLSASLVIFTHSVCNFQLASTIANEARTNSIKSYRETLSNRQRRIFDKMSKETIRIRGDTQGKMDIIRNINKIPDRQYLNDLFKVNKKLNEAKVRPAFSASDEGVVLNNEMSVNTAALRQNINLLEQVSQPIPATHTDGNNTASTGPARLLFSGTGRINPDGFLNLEETLNDREISGSSGRTMDVLRGLSVMLPSGIIVELIAFGEGFLKQITDGEKFQDVIETMASKLPEKVVIFVFELTQHFMEVMMREIASVLHFYISTESVLYRILKYILTKLEFFTYDYIVTKRQEILLYLREHYLSLNSNNNQATSTKCSECHGWYYICQL